MKAHTILIDLTNTLMSSSLQVEKHYGVHVSIEALSISQKEYGIKSNKPCFDKK